MAQSAHIETSEPKYRIQIFAEIHRSLRMMWIIRTTCGKDFAHGNIIGHALW